jgi:hypothetical protein
MPKNVRQRSNAPALRGAAPPARKKYLRRALGHGLDEQFRGFFSDVVNRRQRAFLIGFLQTCEVRAAARLSGVSRQSHYEWMRGDPLYREHFRRAREMLADAAEDELYRRAMIGHETPIIFRGKITGSYKTPSDQLLMFMLKALRPHIYRESARSPFGEPGPTEINIRVHKPDNPPTVEATDGESGVQRISLPHPDGEE